MRITEARYGLTESRSTTASSENNGWGSTPSDGASRTADSTVSNESTQSSFIGQTTSSVADEDDGTSADSAESMFALGGQPEPKEPVTEEGSTSEGETPSSPVKAGGVTVSNEELQQRGLTHDDVRFLTRVLEVMNGESTEYTLLDSMSSFKNDFEDIDVQRLVDQSLLDEGRACGRKYYTVLPAGRELLGEKLRVGPGVGDVGEKTPHKVGVRLLELWLKAQDDVVEVKPYYQYDDETVFDVAGFDAEGTLTWVGEAELSSNNKHAPVDDYDKQSKVDAKVIWAFNRRETAVEVLDWLAEADRIESSVSGRAARSFSDIRDAVEELDASGLTTIRSFNNLDRELNL
jgi:hypothetical protein